MERVRVSLPGLDPALAGFRIAQLSDLHVGHAVRRPYVERVVAATNALAPDLIALTGDLVDGEPGPLAEDFAPVGGLRAPEGAYYVTGNHEYYWGALPWIERVRALGIHPLLNEHVVIARGAGRLVLAGVPDLAGERFVPAHACDPARALAGAPAGVPRVLLAHQPKVVTQAAALGVELQLSGHTHAGQFFPWTLIIGLFHPVARGLGRVAGTQLYVSRGTGFWGPPLRLGAPAEITLIELEPAPLP